MGRSESIHYVMLPETDVFACCDDPVIRRQMRRLMMAIEMGRVLRERKTISLKRPVRSIVIASSDPEVLSDIKSLENYLMEELNCLEVRYETSEASWCQCSISPEFSVLGRRLGKNFKAVTQALAQCTAEDVKKLEQEHKLTVAGFELSEEEPADFTIIDLNEKYRIDSREFLSMGHSTPFDGMEVCGRITMTIKGGEVVWER